MILPEIVDNPIGSANTAAINEHQRLSIPGHRHGPGSPVIDRTTTGKPSAWRDAGCDGRALGPAAPSGHARRFGLRASDHDKEART